MSPDFPIGEAHLYPAEPAGSTRTTGAVRGERERKICIFHLLTGKETRQWCQFHLKKKEATNCSEYVTVWTEPETPVKIPNLIFNPLALEADSASHWMLLLNAALSWRYLDGLHFLNLAKYSPTAMFQIQTNCLRAAGSIKYVPNYFRIKIHFTVIIQKLNAELFLQRKYNVCTVCNGKVAALKCVTRLNMY